MSEWVEWRGGRRPVDLSQMVSARFRDKTESPKARPAAVYCWDHYGGNDDIVAYQIYEAPKPQTAGEDSHESQA